MRASSPASPTLTDVVFGRAYVKYSYATGDSDAADGRVGTLQNVFSTNHPFRH